jgi:Zn-dependent alcohol dehydrogenase
MRAAILKEPKGRLEIEEQAVPTPGQGEVLIESMRAACATAI